MKMLYRKPSAEVIRFENEDVITTSNLDLCGSASANGGGGCSNAQKKNPEWKN